MTNEYNNNLVTAQRNINTSLMKCQKRIQIKEDSKTGGEKNMGECGKSIRISLSQCLLYVVYDFLFVKVHEFATSTFLMIIIYLVLESRIENSNLKYIC